MNLLVGIILLSGVVLLLYFLPKEINLIKHREFKRYILIKIAASIHKFQMQNHWFSLSIFLF